MTPAMISGPLFAERSLISNRLKLHGHVFNVANGGCVLGYAIVEASVAENDLNDGGCREAPS